MIQPFFSVQHVKYHIIAEFAPVVQARPTLGIILSFVGGALTLSLAALIASMNLTVALANPMFDFTLVVGLVFCSGGSLLYFRPRRHSAWGAIILIASLVDLTRLVLLPLLALQWDRQSFHAIRKHRSPSRISRKPSGRLGFLKNFPMIHRH